MKKQVKKMSRKLKLLIGGSVGVVCAGAIAGTIVGVNHKKHRIITMNNVLSVKDTILRSMAKTYSDTMSSSELKERVLAVDKDLTKIAQSNDIKVEDKYKQIVQYGLEYNCDTTDWYGVTSEINALESNAMTGLNKAQAAAFDEQRNNLNDLINQCRDSASDADATAQALKSHLYDVMLSHKTEDLEKNDARMRIYLEDFISSISMSRNNTELAYSTFKTKVTSGEMSPMDAMSSSINYMGTRLSHSSLSDYLDKLQVDDDIASALSLDIKINGWDDSTRTVSFSFTASMPEINSDDTGRTITVDSNKQYTITLLQTPSEEKNEISNRFNGAITLSNQTKFNAFIAKMAEVAGYDSLTTLADREAVTQSTYQDSKPVVTTDLLDFSSFFLYNGMSIDQSNDIFKQYAVEINFYSMGLDNNSLCWSYDVYNRESMASTDFSQRGFHSNLQTSSAPLNDACFNEVLDLNNQYVAMKHSYDPSQITPLQHSADCDIAMLSENIISLIVGTAQLVVDIVVTILTLGAGCALIIMGVIGMIGTGLAVAFMPAITDHYHQTINRINMLKSFQYKYSMAVKNNQLIEGYVSRAKAKTLSWNDYTAAVTMLNETLTLFSNDDASTTDSLSVSLTNGAKNLVKNGTNNSVKTQKLKNGGLVGDPIDDAFANLSTILERMMGQDAPMVGAHEWETTSLSKIFDQFFQNVGDSIEAIDREMYQSYSRQSLIADMFSRLEKGVLGGNIEYEGTTYKVAGLLKNWKMGGQSNSQIIERLRAIPGNPLIDKVIEAFNLGGMEGGSVSDRIFTEADFPRLMNELLTNYISPTSTYIDLANYTRKGAPLSPITQESRAYTSMARSVDYTKQQFKRELNAVMSLSADQQVPPEALQRLKTAYETYTQEVLQARAEITRMQGYGGTVRKIAQSDHVISSVSAVIAPDVEVGTLTPLEQARHAMADNLRSIFMAPVGHPEGTILTRFPTEPITGADMTAFKPAVDAAGLSTITDAAAETRLELSTLWQTFGMPVLQADRPVAAVEQAVLTMPTGAAEMRVIGISKAYYPDQASLLRLGEKIDRMTTAELEARIRSLTTAFDSYTNVKEIAQEALRRLKIHQPDASIFDALAHIEQGFENTPEGIAAARRFAVSLIEGMAQQQVDTVVRASEAQEAIKLVDDDRVRVIPVQQALKEGMAESKKVLDTPVAKALPLLPKDLPEQPIKIVTGAREASRILQQVTTTIQAAPTLMEIGQAARPAMNFWTKFTNMAEGRALVRASNVVQEASHLENSLSTITQSFIRFRGLLEAAGRTLGINPGKETVEFALSSGLREALGIEGGNKSIRGMFSEGAQVPGEVDLVISTTHALESGTFETALEVSEFTPNYRIADECVLQLDGTYFSEDLKAAREALNKPGGGVPAHPETGGLTNEEHDLILEGQRLRGLREAERLAAEEQARTAENARTAAIIAEQQAAEAARLPAVAVKKANILKRFWDCAWDYYRGSARVLTEVIGPIGRAVSNLSNPAFLIVFLSVDLSFNIITSIIQSYYDQMANGTVSE